MLYGGLTPEAFLARLQAAISVHHVWVGLIKAPFMALTIGVIATIDCSWSWPLSSPTWGGLTLEVVAERSPRVVDEYHDKLRARVDELMAKAQLKVSLLSDLETPGGRIERELHELTPGIHADGPSSEPTIEIVKLQGGGLGESIALSAGVERADMQAVVRDALATVIEPAVYAEALDLVEAHHRAGHDVVIVSASVIEVVEPIATLIGADRAVATRLETDAEGRFTGRVERSLLHGAKVEALEEDTAEHGIDLARSWAYSDSISDRPMLEAVGHPVAVNPDRELRRLAEQLDWPVRDFERPVNLRRPLQPTIPRPNLAPVRAIPSAVLPLRWELVVNTGVLTGVAALTATAVAASRR